MESKSINRYNTFCKSLKNLEKSKYADPSADFVLEGTVLNFRLTFDIAWKVMKDILVKNMGILDFATGSPRETLQQAFTNHLIDDDTWMQMLKPICRHHDQTPPVIILTRVFECIIKRPYPFTDL